MPKYFRGLLTLAATWEYWHTHLINDTASPKGFWGLWLSEGAKGSCGKFPGLCLQFLGGEGKVTNLQVSPGDLRLLRYYYV